MDRETAKQTIRISWRQLFPADRKRKGIICPLCRNGSGSSGDGITENPNKPGQLTCWKCGFQGDAIDLYQKRDGTDYNTALITAAADLGITIDPYKSEDRTHGRTYPTPQQYDIHNLQLDELTARRNDAPQAPQSDETSAEDKKVMEETKAPETSLQSPTEAGDELRDYFTYYQECMKRINDPAATLYLQARGISLEVAARHWIGYDPEWISPTVRAAQEAKGSSWLPEPTARIILPVTNNHYIARAISPDAAAEYSKMNETGNGKLGIFNIKNALRGDSDAVFINEGVFDALSIIEAGGMAIALNSTSNANLLIEKLEERPTKATMILSLDNDDAGRKATQIIREGLARLNISYITADISGEYKDPNDALVGNREEFTIRVRAAEQQARIANLPGLLTLDDAVNEFNTADDSYIELPSFKSFSEAAKIKKHSSVVLAADTGAGKSSLAINFLNDLNDKYPCIYVNLEMDRLTVLRRLVAIQSGLELDQIEGYQRDDATAAAVNSHLQVITTRKPLQIIQGAYILEDLEQIIEQSVKGRTETTIVFIDHSLLVDLKGNSSGRYDRFTRVSEGLRKIALKYNVILFVLLQQSRAGKAEEEERPRNSSLKESGSWENDATHIMFLWYDPAARCKKILLTKNRNGESGGEYALNYWKKTQTYMERKDQPAAAARTNPTPAKKSRREIQREKLQNAYNIASIRTNGRPTLLDIAEAADVTTTTVKGWIKEYGGAVIDGQQIDPAGIDTEVEYTGFVKLTPNDDNEIFPDNAAEGPSNSKKVGNGQTVTARY